MYNLVNDLRESSSKYSLRLKISKKKTKSSQNNGIFTGEYVKQIANKILKQHNFVMRFRPVWCRNVVVILSKRTVLTVFRKQIGLY